MTPDDSTSGTLGSALEREHRQIDDGIEAFLAARSEGAHQLGALRRAIEALRRHIFLEEEFLFPPLREAGMVAPVFVMLREHGEIWDTLDTIDAQLRADSADGVVEEACRTLLAQLEKHNAKEEPILYPQADVVLSTGASASLSSFLATGRMPEGWVSAQAGA